MRIVLACSDVERADWIAHVLGEDGFSVVVLTEVGASSPELRGAELVIADPASAKDLGEEGDFKRVLLSSRGSTIDLSAIQGRFADILVVPAPAEEVVARVRHVLGIG